MENIKLIKIVKDRVIYRVGNDIINVPLTPQAKEILRYYQKLPAND